MRKNFIKLTPAFEKYLLLGLINFALTSYLSRPPLCWKSTSFLASSGWGVSGLLAVGFGGVMTGYLYDALLHALFLGFVFSMVFGHAPIIFPAVTGLTVSFHRGFYAPWILLHASLLIRVVGDLAGWYEIRLWGGLINALTVAFFLLLILSSAHNGYNNRGDEGRS